MTGLASVLGYAPGTLALWFALAAGVLTIAAYARAQRLAPEGAGAPTDGYLDAIAGARRLYTAFAIGVLLAAVVLMKLLFAHDFRVSYVTSYSGRDLPWFYLFSTFWAGQEGSFLTWLVFGALILMRRRRISLYRSRPAIVLWLLVALLHLGVVGDGSTNLLAEPFELMLLGAVVVQFILPTRNREQLLNVLRHLALQVQSCFPKASVVPAGYSPRPPPSC